MSEFVEFTHDGTTWRADTDFMVSRWHCIWGRGCPGIEDTADPDAMLGCCSVGAQMADQDEAMEISALAALIPRHLFQHADHEVFRDDQRTLTAIVDGACVFLNRPGFAGGAGCALHLAAVDAGESPVDWKPAVCWQLPLRVEVSPDESTVVLRRWRRDDWGPGGQTMAAMCTDVAEVPEAFDGQAAAVETLSEELTRLMGPSAYSQLRARLPR
ncbi:MAG: hypothetical protein R2770_05190 [Acidimicrobiales bacterium]